MNKYFASAIILAALCGTASANPVTSVGSSPMNNCFAAAQRDAGGALPLVDRRAAITDCNDALADKLRPEDRTATLVNRGILNANGGKVDAALADYTEALARNPNSAEVYIARGSALLRAQRYDDARADFDHALTIGTSNNALAMFDRGVANEKSGNLTAAYHDYKQAANLDPNFKPAGIELARFKVSEDHVAIR